VDLTRIDSINVLVAQTVISEVGLDMSRWNTEAVMTRSRFDLCILRAFPPMKASLIR